VERLIVEANAVDPTLAAGTVAVRRTVAPPRRSSASETIPSDRRSVTPIVLSSVERHACDAIAQATSSSSRAERVTHGRE
jgi:hypothetical protein